MDLPLRPEKRGGRRALPSPPSLAAAGKGIRTSSTTSGFIRRDALAMPAGNCAVGVSRLLAVVCLPSAAVSSAPAPRRDPLQPP